MEKSIKRDVGMAFTLSVRHGEVYRVLVFSHAISWGEKSIIMVSWLCEEPNTTLLTCQGGSEPQRQLE